MASYLIETSWSADPTMGVTKSVGYLVVNNVRKEVTRGAGPKAHYKILGELNEEIRMRGQNASKWFQTVDGRSLVQWSRPFDLLPWEERSPI